MTDYQPGACNIGRDERRKRRVTGVLSFLVAAGYVGFVVGTGRPAGSLLGTFPFLFGGFVGVVQDQMRFCAGFGVLARYDLAGSGGEAGQVIDEAAVRKDRVRAFEVFAIATAAAVVTTLAIYALGATL